MPGPQCQTAISSTGAEVFLNGKRAGNAGAEGGFSMNDVPAGQYEVGVKLKGYRDWSVREHIHPSNRIFNAQLEMLPEKIQEIESNRGRLVHQIKEARRLFALRNYQGAVAALNDALTLDPLNTEARTLREQVEETIKILGR